MKKKKVERIYIFSFKLYSHLHSYLNHIHKKKSSIQLLQREDIICVCQEIWIQKRNCKNIHYLIHNLKLIKSQNKLLKPSSNNKSPKPNQIQRNYSQTAFVINNTARQPQKDKKNYETINVSNTINNTIKIIFLILSFLFSRCKAPTKDFPCWIL